MIQRCTNPCNPDFHHYGGRGITVCDRWRASFENFFADMGERPPGTSLDRWPDNNGNYESGNCRWATVSEQRSNTRRNVRVVFQGEEMILAEALRRSGISTELFEARRYSMGWSADRALSTPPRKYRKT